jgi:hypothetical protein
MKTIRVVSACLVAAFAFSAVAAASASAAGPALYECAKAGKETAKYISKGKEKSKSVYTGEYTNKECTDLAPPGKYRAEGKPEGKYTAQEITQHYAVEGKAEGSNLEILGIGGLTCAHSSYTGEFNSPKSADKINITFTDCELSHHQCETGATLGEIKVNQLQARIGYLDAATHEVGALFTPETGTYFVTSMHCAELGLRTIGGVIGQVVSPVDTWTNAASLRFEESSGIQFLKHFEGESEEHGLLTETANYPEGEWHEGKASGESGEYSGKLTSKKAKLELKA